VESLLHKFKFGSIPGTDEEYGILEECVRTEGFEITKELQHHCAYGLVRSCSARAIYALVSYLQSKDPRMAALSVGAFTRFVNGVPPDSCQPEVPNWRYRTPATMAHHFMGEGELREMHAYYVNFWTRWWAENKERIGPDEVVTR
jgi:hypothetical protein